MIDGAFQGIYLILLFIFLWRIANYLDRKNDLESARVKLEHARLEFERAKFNSENFIIEDEA